MQWCLTVLGLGHRGLGSFMPIKNCTTASKEIQVEGREPFIVQYRLGNHLDQEE
jgi:hypothetical protein